jgi:hypothetical protein
MRRTIIVMGVIAAIALPATASAAWQVQTYVSGQAVGLGAIHPNPNMVFTARQFNFSDAATNGEFWNIVDYYSGPDEEWRLYQNTIHHPANTSPTSRMRCGRTSMAGPTYITMTCKTNNNFG